MRYKKIFTISLITIIAISMIRHVSAKSYHYPCHLDVGKTYGLGDGSSNAIEYRNIQNAMKRGDLDYYAGIFVSEWDSLAEELQRQGVAKYSTHKSRSLIETLDLTPTRKCNISDLRVKIGLGYDPDYFDVIFE